MDINIIVKLAKRLFGRINREINGYRIYTKAEIKEDEENFVNAILSENIDYIKEKYNNIFIVETLDKKVMSFTYGDIITKTIIIDYL